MKGDFYRGNVTRVYTLMGLCKRLTTSVILPFVRTFYGSWWRLRCAALTSRGLQRSLLTSCYSEFVSQHNAEIPLDVEINYPPCFPHGLCGVFISSGAKIGRNVVIFQQVTIGSNTLIDHGGSRGGAPTIGDNVYIGAGAKIIGSITIGDNCRIGANCCVHKNMPPHSVAVNSPMRLIQKENLDNRFFYRDGSDRYVKDGHMEIDVS